MISGAVSGQFRRARRLVLLLMPRACWLAHGCKHSRRVVTATHHLVVEYDPSNANNVWATISNFNGTPNAQGTAAQPRFPGSTVAQPGPLRSAQTPGNVNAIPNIPAHSVAIDPNDNQRIYVGTDLGVFVSLDGGANWARETTGFSNTVVESLTTV